MCAVYKLFLEAGSEILEKLGRRYGEQTAEKFRRAELYPKSEAPVLGAGGKVALLSWGVPHPGRSALVFNARAETLSQKPMFRGCLGNRCIVPASLFYEWGAAGETNENGKKQKFEIRPGGELFYFAGLFAPFQGSDGTRRFHFTIVTTGPSAAMAAIHSRMPAILDGAARERWLDPRTPPQAVLEPYAKEIFIERAV